MPLDSIAVLSILDRVTDANGNPVSGATLEFYEAGTTTPLTVYADAALTTSLGAVVTCDAGGYPTSDGTAQVSIYTGTQSYKVVAKTSGGVIVTTRDNVKGAPDIPDTTSSALPETPVVTRTSTYTILSTDRGKLINADPTSGSFAVTLPSAVTVGDGWMIGVRHAGNTTNVVTVRTTGGQTIAAAGLSSATSHSLSGRGHTRWYKSDGAGYTVDSEVSPLMSGPLPFFRATDRLTAPPASPVGGARYIINGTPTGTWSTLGFAENDVAESDGNGSWFNYTPVAGFFAYVLDEDLFTKFDGTSWEDQTGMSAPSSSTLKRAVIEHREVNGTAGGSSTANAWQNRTLNTSVVSDITGLSLASSEITLPAGTYLISAMQHLYAEVGTLGGVTFAQQRINAVTAVLGESHLGVGSRIGGVATGAGVTFTATNSIELRDTFVVTVATGGTIALQYYVTTAQATNGLGYPSPETTVGFECYARVSIISLSALQGPPGEQGVQGEGGLDASFPYQWSTATSGDPGSGKVRGNNATIASITEIGVSETDSAGGAMAAVLATWDDSNSAVRGMFRIAKEGAVGNFHVFHISGSGTDQGTYWTFPVTYVATSGTISNGTDCAVNFSFTGDKGDPGTTVPDPASLSTITDHSDETDYVLALDTSSGGSLVKTLGKNLGFTQAGTGAALRRQQAKLREIVSPEDFGAVGDGSTTDTTAFSNALAAFGATGGTLLLNAAKQYRIGSITIPANVTVKGHVKGLDSTADNLTFNFDDMGSTLLLASGATISVGTGACLEGCVVRPYGLSIEQSDSSTWADTAVTMTGYGAAVLNNIILGFNLGIVANNISRLRIEWNAIDCNNGIDVEGTYDSTRILNNHCWPYLTHKSFWNSGANYAARDKTKLYRTGNGIYLSNGTDDTHVDGNLVYGFLVGLRAYEAGALNWGRNWVDHPFGVNRTNNYGVVFEGTVDNMTAQTLFIWGTKVGLYANSTGTIAIDLVHAESIDDSAVYLDSGNIRIGHLDAHDCGNRAVNITSATNVTLDLDSWDFRVIDAAEAIALPANATTENIYIGQGTSDEIDGTALTGANNLLFASVSSGSTMNLPAHGTWFNVTGTTTINTIAGAHGGRRIVLRFAAACTVASGAGNITLDAAFTSGGAGGTLELYYDGHSATWRELSRNIGHVIGPSSATDGNIALFDGATGRKIKESSFALTTLTGAWTSYTPTITAGSGSFTTVSATGKYKTIGKTTTVQISVTITTNGTAATAVVATLPNTSANIAYLVGKESGTGGMVTGAIGAGGTTAFIVTYNNLYPGGSGVTVVVNGTYENN